MTTVCDACKAPITDTATSKIHGRHVDGSNGFLDYHDSCLGTALRFWLENRRTDKP